MEKVKKSISKLYSPVKLYLDDLEKILAIFEKYGISCYLNDNEYKLNYDDLIEKYNSMKLHELSIKSDFQTLIRFQKLSCTVDMWPHEITEMELSGLFYEIDNVLSRCLIKPTWFFNMSVWTILLVLNAILYFGLTIYLGFVPKLLPPYYTITFLMAIWFLVMFYIKMNQFSTIVISCKKNENFLKRNKDQLLLLIIGSIIGSFFGIIGTIIVTKLTTS